MPYALSLDGMDDGEGWMQKGKRGRSGAPSGRDTGPRRPQPPILDLTAVEVPPAKEDMTTQSDDPQNETAGTSPHAHEEPPHDPALHASGDAHVPPGAVEGSNFTMVPAEEPSTAENENRADAAPNAAEQDSAASHRATVPAILPAPPLDATTASGSPGASAATDSRGATAGRGAEEFSGSGPAERASATGRSRTGPAMAAGFLAGLLAGCGAALGTLWYTGLYPPPPAATSDTQPRIVALESQVRQLAARPTPLPATAASTASDPRVDELAGRLTRLESALAAQPAKENQAPDNADLTGRIADLDKRFGAVEAGAGAAATAVKDLQGRLGAVEESAGAATAGAEDLRKRLDTMAASVQTARDSANRAAGAATSAAADAATSVESVGKRLKALEESTAGLQSALRKPDRDVAARLASAALALRLAVQQDHPFEGELSIVKASADTQLVAALQPFAAGGLPSAGALASDLKQRLAALRQTAKAQADEAQPDGLLDRLQSAAGKLVRVTPAGAPSPGNGDASLAALDAAADRGDLPAALAEWGKLPDKTKAALALWADKAKARLDAVTAAERLSHNAIAALSPPASEPVTR